ncbi:MAG: glycosyltransferase family 4 protein [Candidatus Andersenbacteria bacterium]|nr:glycosyltransferase family 4 protein [Candidatus Andersenbacteria bacterium]MBI3250263.1 glycosyltransferase family 4 protein [Candidatus Andersenbacteria bacterium]
MKIAIEARGLIGARGVRTYIYQLVRHLIKNSPSDELEILHGSRETMKDFPTATNSFIPLPHDAIVQWWLSRAVSQHLRRSKPTIVHFTKADVPSRKLSIPAVTTIFDVIPLQLPSTQSFLRRLYWRKALQRAGTLSDHIITISEASKKNIIELLQVDPNKITVTPMAVDLDHFKHTEVTSQGSPYILFVGRWDERKNIPALIKAFAIIKDVIPHNLIIAGRPADKPINLKAVAKRAGVEGRVIFRENVSYTDLPALYSGADVFVYPSVIEGWGFPPHEAMACGTPVIVSNGDPLPEVVGESGEVVVFSTNDLLGRLNDSEFISRLADKIQGVLINADRRQQMKTMGPKQARKFSWDTVAEETLRVYHRITQ